jgi:hypothetical protein
MLLPQEEYIINKHANIRGVDVLLLSFTIEEDKNRLWLMYENWIYVNILDKNLSFSGDSPPPLTNHS